MAAPKAMSHGLTGAGGAFVTLTGISAASAELAESAATTAAANTDVFFIVSPFSLLGSDPRSPGSPETPLYRQKPCKPAERRQSTCTHQIAPRFNAYGY